MKARLLLSIAEYLRLAERPNDTISLPEIKKAASRWSRHNWPSSKRSHAQRSRDGQVRSSDGTLDLDLRVPEELKAAVGAAKKTSEKSVASGERGERATNPEQVFAAGCAACFEGTLREVARTRKLPLTDARIRARAGSNPRLWATLK